MILAAVAVNALRAVGREGAPAVVYSFAAAVVVIGVAPWPCRSVLEAEATRRPEALPLRVGAVSAGVGALVALLVFWYDVSEQQATLREGMQTAGRVLIIVLFVTGLAVAITFAVGSGKNGA